MCFHLEQATGNSSADPALSAEFEAWLPKVSGPLPKPDPELERRWDAPFARWACGAQAGDAPMVGIVYEGEDAVHFAMAYTGREEGIVRAVLNAQQRYLELALTASVPQEEGLLRERAEVRHLLSDDPQCLDGRQEMEYLKLVTGLAEEVIDSIRDGELAYIESIGITEMSGGGVEEEGVDRILGHHRSHWEAVADDLSDVLATFVAEPPKAEGLRVCVPSPDPRWPTVTSTAVSPSEGLEIVRIDGRSGEGSNLITAFPVARDGAPFSVRIDQVLSGTLGCEAIVEAAMTLGGSICFFDIDHLHPWREWEEGVETLVALSAFACALKPAHESQNGVRRKIRETERMGFKMDPGILAGMTPVEIRPRLFPCAGDHPDEYEFLGPVETLDVVRAWGQTFYRMDITLACKGEMFTLPVYAAEHVLEDGYRPWIGDIVQGRLWLQGGLPKGQGKVAIISTDD